MPTTHYQKGTKRIPAIRLRTILRHRGNSATHLRTLGNVLRSAFPFEKCLPPGGIFTSIALIIAKPPKWGSETFLPGGRPPVNVSSKGGRSPTRSMSAFEPNAVVSPMLIGRIGGPAASRSKEAPNSG